jgi:hypothetical protein
MRREGRIILEMEKDLLVRSASAPRPSAPTCWPPTWLPAGSAGGRLLPAPGTITLTGTKLLVPRPTSSSTSPPRAAFPAARYRGAARGSLTGPTPGINFSGAERSCRSRCGWPCSLRGWLLAPAIPVEGVGPWARCARACGGSEPGAPWVVGGLRPYRGLGSGPVEAPRPVVLGPGAGGRRAHHLGRRGRDECPVEVTEAASRFA